MYLGLFWSVLGMCKYHRVIYTRTYQRTSSSERTWTPFHQSPHLMPPKNQYCIKLLFQNDCQQRTICFLFSLQLACKLLFTSLLVTNKKLIAILV